MPTLRALVVLPLAAIIGLAAVLDAPQIIVIAQDASQPAVMPSSQGLGLTESEFDAVYGSSQEDIMGRSYVVGNGHLIPYTTMGDPAPIVERTFDQGITYDDAVSESVRLMPSDAVHVQQYVNAADIVVDVYTSEWLKGQFPDPDDWTNADPGTFIVEYGSYNPTLGNQQVTRMLLGIGNNP